MNNNENGVQKYLDELKNLGQGDMAEIISLLWGDRLCHKYISSLVFNYNNNRSTLSEEVFSILLKIFEIHSEKFGYDEPTDHWRG